MDRQAGAAAAERARPQARHEDGHRTVLTKARIAARVEYLVTPGRPRSSLVQITRGGLTYQRGSGITSPRVLREVKPQYTSDAMRAKVQGTVLVACVVRPDGTVGDVQIVRSLDPTFGLDLQAIAAVKQWKFAARTRLGEPVAVRITIELTFTLR